MVCINYIKLVFNMYFKNRVLINDIDISVVAGDYFVKVDHSIDNVLTAHTSIENDIIRIGNNIAKEYPNEKYNIGVLTSDIIDIEDMINDRELINIEKTKLIDKNELFKEFIHKVAAIYGLHIALDYYYMLYDCYTHDMEIVELPIYKIDTIALMLDNSIVDNFGTTCTNSFYKAGKVVIVDSDFAFDNEGSALLNPRFAGITENVICVMLDKFKQKKVKLTFNKNKDQKASYIRIDFNH